MLHALLCKQKKFSRMTGTCVYLQTAASAVFLANNMLGQAAWTPTLHHYSGYKPCDLMECVKLMHQVHLAQRTSAATPAIRDKYAQPKFCCVSAIQGRPDAMQSSLFR